MSHMILFYTYSPLLLHLWPNIHLLFNLEISIHDSARKVGGDGGDDLDAGGHDVRSSGSNQSGSGSGHRGPRGHPYVRVRGKKNGVKV